MRNIFFRKHSYYVVTRVLCAVHAIPRSRSDFINNLGYEEAAGAALSRISTFGLLRRWSDSSQ